MTAKSDRRATGDEPGSDDHGAEELPGGDPAAMLDMIHAERERTSRATEPDPLVIYGLWSAAWLVGFFVLWSQASGSGPAAGLRAWVAGTVFAGCLVAAMVLTGVHIARRTAGVRGVSAMVGAMYGWSWLLAFAALTLVMTGAFRAGLPPETGAMLWAGLSGLVVGTLYLAGGALWQDRVQYGLGLWVLVSSGVGALAGYPGVYLVMCLGGGGGFGLAAAFFTLRRRYAGRRHAPTLSLRRSP